MNDHRAQTHFFLVLFLAALGLTAYAFLPYVSALILAAVFAVIFTPVYEEVRRNIVQRESWAALITVVLVALIVLLPLSFFGYQLFQEASSLYFEFAEDGGSGLVADMQAYLQNLFPDIGINLNEYLRQLLSWLIQNVGSIFSGLAQVFFTVFLGLLGTYYLLKDGGRFKVSLLGLVPLPEEYAETILTRVESMVGSVIKGSLAVAIIQGIVAGVGFTLFGIPNPAFWGSLAVIAALVPTVGTALVMLPAVAYLFFIGHTGASLGLLIWAAAAVGLIDNLLAPYLIQRRAKIHPFLILISVLGGISVFGPIGFLAGPLLLSLLFALIDLYPVVMKADSD